MTSLFFLKVDHGYQVWPFLAIDSLELALKVIIHVPVVLHVLPPVLYLAHAFQRGILSGLRTVCG